MSAPRCAAGCGRELKKPGKTGLCRVCFPRQPKSAATRTKMRKAAFKRVGDPAFKARWVEAVRAGVAASMENPVERERRVAWGRQMGLEHGAAMSALLGPAGSPKRMANGRKVSATKLAWCPLEYRATYRDLTKVRGIPTVEAKRMVLDQVEADRRRFVATGTLPQAERAAR